MLPQGMLGELLVERGLITTEQLRVGLAKQEKIGSRIGSILVKLGYISEEDLLRFLSMYYDVPQIDLRRVEIHPQAVKRLSVRDARQFMVLPVKFVGRPPDASVLIVATPDPSNVEAIEKVRQIAGCPVEPFVCSFGMFEVFFAEVYQESQVARELHELLQNTESDQLTIALARLLVDKKIITCAELKTALTSDEELCQEEINE